MRRSFPALVFFLLFFAPGSFSQKIPLDHSVYDAWQHIGETLISADGKWVVYTIEPQQGDNELIIQSADGQYRKSIARGYGAVITNDSRFVVFKIKPLFRETREAKIKKKKADDMPKDSLGIIQLGSETVERIPRVRSFKTAPDGTGMLGVHFEKKIIPSTKAKVADSSHKKIADSLVRIIDSLNRELKNISGSGKKQKKRNRDTDETSEWPETGADAEGDEGSPQNAESGTDLLIRNLETGKEETISRVTEFYISKNGSHLILEQARDPKDSLSANRVMLVEAEGLQSRVLSSGGNEFRSFAISNDASRFAWLAEREAKPGALQKYYRVWYYSDGMDSAMLLADKNTVGMQLGMTVSEFGNPGFSRSGRRLFFGSAQVQPPKDTTLVEFEHARVDIWHYNDDYLQTVQNFPSRLQAAKQENYLTVFDLEENKLLQLGNSDIPVVQQTDEGEGNIFVAVTDVGKRIPTQWQGFTLKDVYAVNPNTGEKKLVRENLVGNVYPSPSGKHILWYDRKARHYFLWDGAQARNISSAIKYPLWNEESDIPEEPGNYGVMGWHENDSFVYVYDKYDVWAISLLQPVKPFVISGLGRANKYITRYVKVNDEERFIRYGQPLYFRYQNDINKEAGLWRTIAGDMKGHTVAMLSSGPYSYNIIRKAKDSDVMLYTKENFADNPDLYLNKGPVEEMKLSAINPQQNKYLWGTAELITWKALNGKTATGIVYKPENFEEGKKYPVIIYFYEKLSQGLFDYKEPAPIRSAVNVPFFVSRGYIVFMPDIIYKTGYPGQSAYDYIVSGANALVKKGWADPARMALQGHSWGGYQAAQVATMTKMFKAVWAGAPVANMTSAYGGIRWESGASRQFQYERTQSRIGGTLWEKLPLYLQNSPLFHLDKVTAPMVIMHNDADGAVPWYQGIELFSGLRRLGKKVWMFNYNGQGHGLTQRQDMLDYQIRMQQFFDWILKDAPPARWITEGVPAVKKGRDWGLE